MQEEQCKGSSDVARVIVMVAMAITCTVTMVITILFIFNQAEHFPILLLSLLCC